MLLIALVCTSRLESSKCLMKAAHILFSSASSIFYCSESRCIS